MSKVKDDYRPHTIILPSYCPVLICASKHAAEGVADRLGYKNYRIQPTTKRDVECLIGEIQDLPNV